MTAGSPRSADVRKPGSSSTRPGAARVGDAQVSEMHTNFLINLGNATAADV
jgi:hypothetical protein